MVRAHRRMGRENADDNETFRRAGHCNRPTMRLLGSFRWRARTGVSLLPRAHQLRAERGTLSVRIVRTKDREKEGERARYCYQYNCEFGWQERDETFL